jgi:hypothetical protein
MTRSKEKRYQALGRAQQVKRLLTILVRFLRASEVPPEYMESVIRSAYQRAFPAGMKVARVESVKVDLDCAQVVLHWRTLPEFLNDLGYPRELQSRGRGGFRELVQKTNPKLDPAKLLRDLKKFGSVVVTRSGRLRLVTDVHLGSTPSGKVMAFEPNIQFLIDAVGAVDDQLDVRLARKGTARRYWRDVENLRVPAEHYAAFIAFSKRRVMAFNGEIQDWLDQHAKSSRRNNKKFMRLGIAAFAIAEKA